MFFEIRKIRFRRPAADNAKSLCLNMIVHERDGESERCLTADHPACWVIGDTRLTDGRAKVSAYSVKAAESFSDGSLDFVYIDANHTFQHVNQDLRAWYPKLRVGGLICGHDAVDTDETARNAEGNIEIAWERDANGTVTSGGHYGVLKAVRAFCSEHDIEFLLSGTQFLIQKKVGNAVSDSEERMTAAVKGPGSNA
jgi:Methyltransferase domain